MTPRCAATEEKSAPWFARPFVVAFLATLLVSRLDYSAWWICVVVVFVNWPVIVERLQQASSATLPPLPRRAPG